MMKRHVLLLIFIFAISNSAFANVQSNIDNGLNWLFANQNLDSSFGNQSDLIFRDTEEVLNTLNILNQKDSQYQNGIQWAVNTKVNNIDFIARKILLLSKEGIDTSTGINLLLPNQNTDGGWGLAVQESDSIDTVLALQALKAVNFSDQTIIQSTINYVLSIQNPDGGWGFYQGDESSVYMTALVSMTLQQFPQTTSIATAINKATFFLIAHQNTDGGFGSSPSTVFETALSYLALVNEITDAIVIGNAINYLTSSQLPDGSWNDDPYSTALALRALANVKPNLSISATDITFSKPNPTVGDTIMITANIKNTGPAQADNVLIRFFAGDPASGGVLIGEATVASVSAYGSAPASVTWTIPTASTRAIYVVLNTIDELNETDNTASKNLTSATLPDLSIVPSEITFSPSSPNPGDVVTITATIRNLGETGASNVTVDIYDGDPASGGISLYNTTVPSIGGGGFLTLQIVGSFASGIHNIHLVVDKANSINESNKSNNTAMKTLQIGVGFIDLSITRHDILFAPVNPIEGNTVSINATIHNESDAAATNILVRFYLGDPDAGGTQIGQDVNIPSIQPRATAAISTTWNTTGHAGNNNIYVKVDPLNIISETNKCNNKAFTTIKVAASTGPDLTITTPDLNITSINPTEGDIVTITANIRNTGTSDASNVLVEFSLGDPNVGGTLIIGSKTIPFIAKSSSATAQLVWNTAGFAGSYKIYANIDPFNEIAELSEINNTAHTPITITAPQGSDLTIVSIDTTRFITDTQTLQVSGSVRITIENKGNQPVTSPFEITAFETNLTAPFSPPCQGGDGGGCNILGKITYTNNLLAGATDTIDIPISGSVLFRDNRIYVMTDSGNAINELDETNNIRNTGQQCEYIPPVGSFNTVEKWKWTGSTNLPAYNQVMQTPVVARIVDTNGDGVIDDKDVPAIIFVSYYSSYLSDGVLRAIRGDNGQEIFTVTNPSYRTNPSATLAVGDIDNDGFVEIVGVRSAGGTIAFRHDGTMKWTSSYGGNQFTGGLAISDIDSDGNPEIIVGATVLNGDGSLKWESSIATVVKGYWGQLSIMVDLDLDGRSEIIIGNTALRNDGSILWQARTTSAYGHAAAANFDNDPYPEIALVQWGSVYLLDHLGNIKWGPIPISGGGSGGPPVIADVDGDGIPEIGVASAYRYMVIKSDGSILWQSVIQDYSSHQTGSSVFDFDGDGKNEVVYNDENYLYIFRGSDGLVMFKTLNSTWTMFENPVIVDVDNDNHAEIVVAANYYSGTDHGIRVFKDANNTWVNTRKIWNQHSYHITNVNDDGTIPRYEENSWERYNTYRCNSMLPDQALASADITTSYITIDQTNYPSSVILSARIGNGGAASQISAVDVVFYNGDPQAGGVLIGTSTTSKTINPGEYQDVSVIWTSPSFDGSAIYVIADKDGKLHECRRDNNIATTTAMADLEITASDITITPSDIREGQTAAITATVRNIGGQGVLNVTVSFYDGDPSADGILIGSWIEAGIAPGSSVVKTIEWNTAGQSGRNYIYVIADPEGIVQELNKSNNYAFIPVDVSPPVKPDLAIKSSDIIIANSNPEESEQNTINAVIHNIGTAAGPVDVCLYDGDPRAGGTLIACKVISEIIPFLGQTTAIFAVKTPGPAGSHRFYVSADPYSKIDEADKMNNSASVSLTVEKASLGLSVSTDNAAYGAREDVRITVNVTNRSTVINPALKVTIEDSAGNEMAVVSSFLSSAEVFQPWVYRISAQISKSVTLKAAFAETFLDFSQIFGALGVSPWTVDTNSVRVIESNAAGNVIGEKQAKAFFEGGNKAKVIWFVDGITEANVTRYFHIYFDILENGTKPLSTHATLPVRGLIGFTDGYGKIYVVRNNNDGTFGTAQLVDTAVYTYDFGIAVADFNNDGFDDIITGSGSTGEIFYYQNKADGTDTFLPKQTIGSITPSGYIMDMAVADFDGDGNKDFVVGGNDNNLYLFKGKGDGTFIKSVIPSPLGFNYFRGKATADFNNDDKMDLVVGSYSGPLYFYKGNGDGTFASPVFIANIGADTYGVTAGDFDGDGVSDIIVNTGGSGSGYFLKGKGDGTFAVPSLVPSLATNNYTGLDVGDLNNDGKTDVILGIYTGFSLYYFPGNGDGTFGPKATIATISSGLLIGISASSAMQGMPAQLGSPEQVPPQTYSFIWNTGSTPAGDYTVHASLAGGQAVLDAYAGFKILPDRAIDAKTVTDKISYTANQPVTITSQVRSVSTNYIFQNLTAKITISNQQLATDVYTETQTISILLPDQLTELNTYWNTTTNPKGSYTVKLDVLEGAAILSTSLATFEILGSKDTGDSLIGTITALPNPVYQGRDETITYTVTNKGNEDIANLDVKVLIVDPETQEIKNTFNSTINLSMNTTATGNFVSSTSNLTPRVYLAILHARTSTMPEFKTLTSTTFEVKPGIEVMKTIPDVKNILVWLNYPWQSMQNCPDRTLIEKALNEAGVSYHIVLDKKDFDAELRNPWYTDIMILGTHNPIEDHISEELREQVNSGKGLITSMFYRQNLNEDVFGIRYLNSLSGIDFQVELAESEISGANTFQAYGRALDADALNPQETIGWIIETTKKETYRHPGIVKHTYGLGKVLYYAFDLGLSTGNYSQFASLLVNSLQYAHRHEGTDMFRPGQMVPVEIKMKSLGAAFDLRITEIYPSDLKLYDASTGQWITDSPWVMNVNLSPNETKTILYYVLTPDKTGTYTLQTEVEYVENGTYSFYQNLSANITVNKTISSLTGDIVATLNGLQVSGQERAKVNNAILYIQNVQNRPALTASDIELNIRDILKAIDSLLFIASADISNIRLMMDELLCVCEGRFYFNRFTQ